jgi:hypothetical protein
MDWRCDSSDRALALQAQNPELKVPQKKKKKKIQTNKNSIMKMKLIFF